MQNISYKHQNTEEQQLDVCFVGQACHTWKFNRTGIWNSFTLVQSQLSYVYNLGHIPIGKSLWVAGKPPRWSDVNVDCFRNLQAQYSCEFCENLTYLICLLDLCLPTSKAFHVAWNHFMQSENHCWIYQWYVSTFINYRQCHCLSVHWIDIWFKSNIQIERETGTLSKPVQLLLFLVCILFSQREQVVGVHITTETHVSS